MFSLIYSANSCAIGNLWKGKLVEALLPHDGFQKNEGASFDSDRHTLLPYATCLDLDSKWAGFTMFFMEISCYVTGFPERLQYILAPRAPSSRVRSYSATRGETGTNKGMSWVAVPVRNYVRRSNIFGSPRAPEGAENNAQDYPFKIYKSLRGKLLVIQ